MDFKIQLIDKSHRDYEEASTNFFEEELKHCDIYCYSQHGHIFYFAQDCRTNMFVITLGNDMEKETPNLMDMIQFINSCI